VALCSEPPAYTRLRRGVPWRMLRVCFASVPASSDNPAMTDPDALVRDALARHQAGALDAAAALYRRALALRPMDHDALHMLGILRAAQGAADEGILLVRQAILMRPGAAAAHFNLGALLLDQGAPLDALGCLRTCLSLSPGHPGAEAAAGRAALRLGRHAEAEAHFGRALAAAPEDAGLWIDRAAALIGLQRFQDAAAACDAALGLVPASAQARHNRATALLALGRAADAVTGFAAALDADPAHRDALHGLAIALEAQGLAEAALAALDRLVALAPAHRDARIRRAGLLGGTERLEEAEADLTAVLARQPADLHALTARAAVRWEAMEPDAALADADAALAIDPGFLPARMEQGNARLDRQDFAGALDSYARVLAADPGHVGALRNTGAALQALQRPAEAIAAYRALLDLVPDDADALMSIGICHLRLGEHDPGWRLNENRWRLPAAVRALADIASPPWDGSADLAGKRVLLLGEQGLGDTIQFCRFARLVRERGARVVLGVEPPLRRLLLGLDGVDALALPGEDPAHDLHCPLMSLPALLGLGAPPPRAPYLRADPVAVAAWRARLDGLPGVRIGLAWAGDPRPHDRMAKRMDRRRSVPLARLAPVLAVPGTSFVSLQIGPAAAQAAGRPVTDWTRELADYADTAALIAALDLVVTVDTSVAHAAGALGKPVWLLNRFDRCWRWELGRTDTPWYPTMRLFTQPAPGDWDSLAREVACALSGTVQASQP